MFLQGSILLLGSDCVHGSDRILRMNTPTKDECAYKPCIGSVGHLKICVYSGMIVQINHEPFIAPKVTPVTHVDWEVVRTDQEACGTRTGSI